ncbi:uncharacterized protein LOC135926343 [Gordionus sp. m RMFG-2023]|uniref:uncharacterized protein LOC135926343 n=1 Tax=Gordionus sp. m RMFG-2023 TaxID=3053472 RepID=UPI0031FCE705
MKSQTYLKRAIGKFETNNMSYYLTSLHKLTFPQSNHPLISLDFTFIFDYTAYGQPFETFDFSEFIQNIHHPLKYLHPIYNFIYKSSYTYIENLPIYWQNHLLNLEFHSKSFKEDSSDFFGFINFIESLKPISISHDGKENTVKFVIIITKENNYSKNEFHQDLTSFTSPGWGSIIFFPANNMAIIHDKNNNLSQFIHSILYNNQKLKSIILLHLYQFIGYPLHYLTQSLYYQNLKANNVNITRYYEGTQIFSQYKDNYSEIILTDHLWRIQNLMRIKICENIAQSMMTLHILGNLVNKITNLIVDKQVAHIICESVQKLKCAMDLISITYYDENLSINKCGYESENSLYIAYNFSKEALINSEKAFYYPTLLEVLYFPQDQKYAIYVPLFFPVLMAIVSYLFAFLKNKYIQKNKIKME